MTRKKNKFLKQKADKRLLLRHYVLQASIVFMFLIVLYDSFQHNTPFYYICFFILGLFIGKIIAVSDRVKHSGEDGTFSVTSSPYGIVISLLLLSIRFAWGRHLLEVANVLWTTDALYLFFIGIYRSKWRGLLRQMEETVYGWLSTKEDASNNG